jgi:hypothetical protein
MIENGTCSRVAAEIVRSQVIRVPTPFPTSTAAWGGTKSHRRFVRYRQIGRHGSAMGSRSDRGPLLFFLWRGVAAILRHWIRVVGHIGRCSPRCAANHGLALS